MSATAELTIILKSIDQATAGIASAKDALKENTKAVEDGTRSAGPFAHAWANVAAEFDVMVQAGRYGIEMLRGLAGVVNEVAEEAAKHQQATDQVTRALHAQGLQSQQNTDSLTAFANKMQETTTFSNTQFMTTMQRLLDMGVKYNDIQKVTIATTELAAAKNLDLETAATLLGKAYNGHTETLRRYGIFIDDNVKQSEKFHEVMKLISSHLGGAAKIDTENYMGAMKQLHNTWEDFKKSIGEWVGPFLIRLSAATRELVKDITAWVNVLRDVAPGYVTAAEAETRAHQLLLDHRVEQQAMNKAANQTQLQDQRNYAMNYQKVMFALYEDDRKHAVEIAKNKWEDLHKILEEEKRAKHEATIIERKELTEIGVAAIAVAKATGNSAIESAAIMIKSFEQVFNAITTAASPLLQILGVVTAVFNASSAIQHLQESVAKINAMDQLADTLKQATGDTTNNLTINNVAPHIGRIGAGGALSQGGAGQLVVVMNNGVFTGTEEEVRTFFDRAMKAWQAANPTTVFA